MTFTSLSQQGQLTKLGLENKSIIIEESFFPDMNLEAPSTPRKPPLHLLLHPANK